MKINVYIAFLIAFISFDVYALSQETYKDWVLLCKESASVNSEECMITTENDRYRVLSIKKDDQNNPIVIISESSTEFEGAEESTKQMISMISTDLALKANKGILHQAKTKPELYDNGLIDYIIGDGNIDFKTLVKEMKRSKRIDVNVKTALYEYYESFSLMGFTKAYDEMVKNDTRVAGGNSSWKRDPNKYEKSVGIGSKESEWKSVYSKTGSAVIRDIYNENYVTGFSEGYVYNIYFLNDFSENKFDGLDFAESFIPEDSKFIKEYSLGGNNRKVRLYNSETLKKSLPSDIFKKGNSGDLIIIYGLEKQGVSEIVIGLGNNP